MSHQMTMTTGKIKSAEALVGAMQDYFGVRMVCNMEGVGYYTTDTVTYALGMEGVSAGKNPYGRPDRTAGFVKDGEHYVLQCDDMDLRRIKAELKERARNKAMADLMGSKVGLAESLQMATVAYAAQMSQTSLTGSCVLSFDSTEEQVVLDIELGGASL